MSKQHPRIKIKESISYYNSKHKSSEKMTNLKLAQAMPGDAQLATRQQMLSNFQSGRHNCPTHWLIAISEMLGVTVDYLVGKDISPTKTVSFESGGQSVTIEIN